MGIRDRSAGYRPGKGLRGAFFRVARVLIALLCGLVPPLLLPEASPAAGSTAPRIIRGVTSEGACAIFGMSAEQCQLLALQKARSSAIEQASGVRVVASTLVRDGAVAVDLINTYSRGFIVAEKVEWLPLAQYQESPDRPPIPEYRVRIRADVAIPEEAANTVGLTARINNKVFRRGEKATIEITLERDARVGVFNITADDRVVMLFPNRYQRNNLLAARTLHSFPGKGSGVSLEMRNLPGHSRDAEAFFVVAVGKEREVDFLSLFGGGAPLALPAFFARYAGIASSAEEVILPYAVEGND